MEAILLWVGLTGGIGTGKSTVAEILRAEGLAVINADEVAHQALVRGTETYNQILDQFGPDILNNEKEIDRARLGEKAFSSPASLRALEKIIHPRVRETVAQEKMSLAEEGHKIVFYDVPLLFEKKLEDEFDKIVVVTASENIQVSRLKHRNNWNDAEILRRIGAQMPLSEKIKQADFVINNDGDLESLKAKVDKLIKDLNQIQPHE